MVVLFGTAGLMAQSTTATSSKDKAACSSKAKSASCCSKGAKTASVSTTTMENPKVLSMARSMADKDETISTRQCAESGTVSFYKQSTCSTSGKISYNEVEFDATNNQFVNKSPKDIGTADEGELIKVVNMTNTETGETFEATVDSDSKKKCTKGAAKCCAKSAAKKTGSQK